MPLWGIIRKRGKNTRKLNKATQPGHEMAPVLPHVIILSNFTIFNSKTTGNDQKYRIFWIARAEQSKDTAQLSSEANKLTPLFTGGVVATLKSDASLTEANHWNGQEVHWIPIFGTYFPSN